MGKRTIRLAKGTKGAVAARAQLSARKAAAVNPFRPDLDCDRGSGTTTSRKKSRAKAKELEVERRRQGSTARPARCWISDHRFAAAVASSSCSDRRSVPKGRYREPRVKSTPRFDRSHSAPPASCSSRCRSSPADVRLRLVAHPDPVLSVRRTRCRTRRHSEVVRSGCECERDRRAVETSGERGIVVRRELRERRVASRSTVLESRSPLPQ